MKREDTVPIERVSTRISIRSLNKAIEYFSRERLKSKKSLEQLKYLINKVPKEEFHSYSRHCVPFAVTYNNIIALRFMRERGFNMIENWGLIISLFKGYDSISKLLTCDTVGLAFHDEIPFAWASYVGNSVSLNELFKDRNYIEMKRWSPFNHYRGVVLRDMLALCDALCKKRNIMSDFRAKSDITPFFINICNKNHIRAEEDECQPPFNKFEKTREMVMDILEKCEKRYVNALDRLGQIIRCYGIMRWGLSTENGYHNIIELFRI